MDAYDAKYTRRGTERVIHRAPPSGPTEGFIDLMGQEVFNTLCAQAYAGKPLEPFTFLKQVRTRAASTVCGYVQSGPRRIFFTLAFQSDHTFEVISYGCDPVFAVPPSSRISYQFEPLMKPEWSFQMRLEVSQRFEQVRERHERAAETMNIQLHFGDTLKARVAWEAYAVQHGLKIVEKAVKL